MRKFIIVSTMLVAAYPVSIQACPWHGMRGGRFSPFDAGVLAPVNKPIVYQPMIYGTTAVTSASVANQSVPSDRPTTQSVAPPPVVAQSAPVAAPAD
jgi:hypothetical protein